MLGNDKYPKLPDPRKFGTPSPAPQRLGVSGPPPLCCRPLCYREMGNARGSLQPLDLAGPLFCPLFPARRKVNPRWAGWPCGRRNRPPPRSDGKVNPARALGEPGGAPGGRAGGPRGGSFAHGAKSNNGRGPNDIFTQPGNSGKQYRALTPSANKGLKRSHAFSHGIQKPTVAKKERPISPGNSTRSAVLYCEKARRP